MYTFRDLQKAKNKEISGKEIRIAILGNCSTQFFSQAIQGLGRLSNMNLRTFDSDYDQIEAQVLDEKSETYMFDPAGIVLWLATEKIYEEFLDWDILVRKNFADEIINRIKHYWTCIKNNSNAKIFQMNYPELNDMVLGQYSGKIESSFIYQIRKLNYLLEVEMASDSRVYPVDAVSVQNNLGRKIIFNEVYYYNAKMTVSMQALPYLADAVISVVKASEGIIKKCVVIDLDNTIWGGIIGEDGLAGIEIGELGKGHVYSDLQRWLKQLKQYGIIIAVCSKNDEEVAREPFIRHREMILKLSDIAVFVANWEDKVSNIRLIRETLNIGFDSMVFLDDNPFERSMVRELLPDVYVPELPEDPAKWLLCLYDENLFESASYSDDSSDRTNRYQTEYERKKEELRFDSIEEYLRSLNMSSVVKAFEEDLYPRIAQLTQRSNQFNLRTVRYSEDEIKRISESNEYLTRCFSLKDRFGEYGLVSLVIMKVEDKNTLFIDTWIMSCRVLKRTMEEFVMNEAIRLAGSAGYDFIIAEYIPTSKNRLVCDIYEKMGFLKIGENRFKLAVRDYGEKYSFVRMG